MPCLLASMIKSEEDLSVHPTMWEMGNLLLAGKHGISLLLLPVTYSPLLVSFNTLCSLQPSLLPPKGCSRQVGLAWGSHNKSLNYNDKLCSIAQSFWKEILMWIKMKEV